MNQETSRYQASTVTILMTIIDVETLKVSTQSGDYILKSTEPMCSIYTRQPTDSNTFVELRLMASPATPPCSPADTSVESLSTSWIGLLRKFSPAILISSLVWAILLC